MAAIELRTDPATVVVQPTPLCNLRCTYCYLPDVSDRSRMPVALSARLAEDLASLPESHVTEVRWHAGEPLTVGVEHFVALLEPFEPLRSAGRLRHSLQTNGTLVSPAWCEVFRRFDVDVGVSLDGPRWANRQRRTLSGAETFDRTLRGIACLNDHEVPFSMIAVVSLSSIPRIVERTAEYLGFFGGLGAGVVGFNVEETEGHHQVAGDERLVRRFWTALFSAWLQAECRPMVREFLGVLGFAEASLAGAREMRPVDLLPTISWDGDVVVLSPELAGYRDERYGDFKVGNLYEQPLGAILREAMAARYVHEFVAGTAECRATCRYFAYCRGGQASNRYFEHGDFTTAETVFCRTTRQAPFDAVVGPPD